MLQSRALSDEDIYNLKKNLQTQKNYLANSSLDKELCSEAYEDIFRTIQKTRKRSREHLKLLIIERCLIIEGERLKENILLGESRVARSETMLATGRTIPKEVTTRRIYQHRAKKKSIDRLLEEKLSEVATAKTA